MLFISVPFSSLSSVPSSFCTPHPHRKRPTHLANMAPFSYSSSTGSSRPSLTFLSTLHASVSSFSSTSPPKTAMILVDHGSRRAAANDMLLDVAAMIRDRLQRAPSPFSSPFLEEAPPQCQHQRYDITLVEIAHMELATPSIQDAAAACVAQGATTVLVVPYFLSEGRHSMTDIPNLVEEERQRYPHVQFVVKAPFGLHPKIVDIVLDRALN